VLISTHVLSGGLLGRAVGRPLPALVAGIASHLALDRLPHWGKANGWPPKDLDQQTFRVAVVDGIAGLVLIGAVLSVVPARHRPQVLAGIVGACLPDLDKPGRRFFGRSPWPERFDELHARLQVDVESPDRLPQDVAVAAAGAAVTLATLAEDDR
jgi:hypothetical protein